MLPEEDVPMLSTHFGLRRWYDREITGPLSAMYAGIDEHLASKPVEDAPPPAEPATAENQYLASE
jgi:hypothetical protein